MILNAEIVAWVICDGAAAGNVASKGVTSITDNGVGDHTITLDEALNANECIVLYEGRGAGLIPQIVHTSNTAKQLLTLDNAGAPADGAYALAFTRIPPIG